MATVSNAGGGSSMSNAQAGTRGLTASDWTNIQKLQIIKRKGWNTNVDGVSTNTTLYSPSMLIPKTTGSSRIRNTASDWTTFMKLGQADYILQTQRVANQTGTTLTGNKVCTCATFSPNKQGICQVCSVGRWYRRRI